MNRLEVLLKCLAESRNRELGEVLLSVSVNWGLGVLLKMSVIRLLMSMMIAYTYRCHF